MMSLHPSHPPLPTPQVPVATHNNLRLRDSHDAHVLFQAVRQGHLPLIRKRLTGPEQQALHAGQVFVWADREGSLERWTDGHNWSPSRVRGPFLMYDEMPEDTEAFLRRKQQQKNGERRAKQPRKKRLPPLPGGLSKQTYSATLIQQGMDIQKWHLTAYFKDDGSNDLLTIDDDHLLRTIIVPDHTFKSSMSRKSKGSSSRRRGSVSERRSDADAESEYCERSRESPIDECSPTRSSRFPSPPFNPVLASPFDFNGSGPISNLPWGLQPASSGGYSSADDPNGGSGGSSGSSGSTGTVHGADGRLLYRSGHCPPYAIPSNPANIHRGRHMHIEGIHTRFESAHPSLGFTSTLSPNTDVPGMVPPSRSQSMSGLPSSAIADWKPFDLNEDRRGSLISIGSSRSTSSQSTSTSSKMPSSGGMGVPSSIPSSPASSFSQQSPYLNPTVASATPSWPAFAGGQGSPTPGQTRVKHEHISSPLGSVSPVVPSSLPAGANASPYRTNPLPSHLQHHPEHVPSAVPPQPPRQQAIRSATLPALYSTGSLSPYATESALTSAWSPVSTNLASPYQSPASPYDSSLPESSAYRFPASYFPHQDMKPTQAELHHPRAVTASGIPGSWEQANTSPYGFARATTTDLNSPLTEQQYQFATAAAGSYAMPGPGEIFDSVVPANRSSHASWSQPS